MGVTRIFETVGEPVAVRVHRAAARGGVGDGSEEAYQEAGGDPRGHRRGTQLQASYTRVTRQLRVSYTLVTR